MFSKKQGRKKRQWQCRIVGVGVHSICKMKGGLTAVVFQLLDKFGMLTFARFLYNAFHFFGKWGVSRYWDIWSRITKGVGGVVGPKKKCSLSNFLSHRKLSNLEVNKFFLLISSEK